jgi:ubiquinone/menaquinone biosynthesis C-methylase UbiE
MLLDHFKTTRELHDLGQFNPHWSGILSPLYDNDFVGKFVQSQFLQEAPDYIEKYQNLPYWKYLLKKSQEFHGYSADDALGILDIGSGAGNTVFPLMELYPRARIVASDLSLPLLKSLKEYREKNYADHVCSVVQMNAEEMIFEENSFDILVGGAILHHLFDPRKTLSQAYKVLKKDGVALFFEPFELGNQILSLLIKQVLELDELSPRSKTHIAPKIKQFFDALCKDFDIRKGSDKSAPIFHKIDDKWLFTKSYFDKLGKAIGFSDIIVYPLYSGPDMFFNQIKTYLRLGLGLSEKDLPDWVLEYIHQYDGHFSPDLHGEIFMEGGLVFIK